jgi:hypothetical protein
MHRLRIACRTRRIWLPPMLAALLFAQLLGLVHRVAHAELGTATVAAAAPAHGDGGLFHAHSDASECRLYDQLMHADLAVGAAAALDALPALMPQAACLPAGRLAPQAAGFLARGPPAQG